MKPRFFLFVHLFYFIFIFYLFYLFIYLFFQASSFQLLELENLLRWSFFTFGSNFGWLIQQMSINQKSGRRRFAEEGFYQALFSFRLARQNTIYKAKRKLSLISGYIISIRKGKRYVCIIARSTSAMLALRKWYEDSRPQIKKRGMTRFKRGKNIRWVIAITITITISFICMTITKYYSIAKATWNYSLIPCKLNI